MPEAPIPSYHLHGPGRGTLLAIFAGKHPLPADVETLTQLVHDGMAHAPSPRVPWREDWLLWLVDHMLPGVGETQRADRLVRAGLGLCHDATTVILELSRRCGWEARMIDLKHHVLAEVDIDGRLFIVDADLGWTIPGSRADLPQLEILEGLAIHLRERGHPEQRVQAAEMMKSKISENT